MDANTAGLTIDGTPVVVTYNDTDTSNNTSCGSFTLVEDVDTGTAINDAHASAEQLFMYPNPANDQIHFVISLDQPTIASVSITDMMGRVVKVQERPVAGKQTNLSLDVTGLHTGLYFVSFAADNRLFTGKIRIQR